jgi:hypothetical protein
MIGSFPAQNLDAGPSKVLSEADNHVRLFTGEGEEPFSFNSFYEKEPIVPLHRQLATFFLSLLVSTVLDNGSQGCRCSTKAYYF